VTRSDTEGGGTLLDFTVEAKVGGKMAQLGSRIIDGFAKKMAAQFFEKFSEVVGGEVSAKPENTEEEASTKKGWVSRLTGG
jgi:hypothetical protein